MSAEKEEPKLQARIVFLEGINRFNYCQVIHEKVKPYEVNGWRACLEGGYSLVKSQDQGKYQMVFVRNIEGKDANGRP
jgi:hypothetical protein